MSLHTLALITINTSLIAWAILRVKLSRSDATTGHPRPARALWSVANLGPRRGIEVAYLGTEEAFDAEVVLVQRPGEFGEPVVLLTRSVSRIEPGMSLHLAERAAPIFDLPGVRVEVSWSSMAGSFHLEVIEISSLCVSPDRVISQQASVQRRSAVRTLAHSAHLVHR